MPPAQRPRRKPQVLREDDPRPQRVGQWPVDASEAPTEQLLVGNLGPPQPRPVPLALYVANGPGQGQLLQVSSGPVILGRAPEVDLRLDHPSVSRRHALLRRQGDHLLVRDLGSHNGTTVNGRAVAGEVVLRPGDELKVGAALLTLRQPGLRKPPPLPAATIDERPTRTRHPLARALALGMAGTLALLAPWAAVRLVASRAVEPPPPESPELASSPGSPPLESPEGERLETGGPTSEPHPEDEALALAPRPRLRRPWPLLAPAPPSPALDQGAQEQAPVDRPDVSEAEVLAAYEQGDAARALSLARARGDAALAALLESFLASHQQFPRALSRGELTLARRALDEALAIDAQLSGGWGTLAAELRRRQAHLDELTGHPTPARSSDEDDPTEPVPTSRQPPPRLAPPSAKAIDEAFDR